MGANIRRKPLVALALGAFLLLCFASEGAAQRTVRLGVKAGADYSKLRLTFDNTDRRLGLIAGAFGRVTFGSGFSVQPELLYAQKGGTIQLPAEEGSAPVEVAYSFDYLEMPVPLQLPVPLGLRVRPRFYGGPYFGVAVRRDISTDPESAEPDEGLPLPESYRDIDYGFVLGASIDLPLGERTFTTDFRWTRGIHDLDPAVLEGTVQDADLSAYNGTLALTVGVLF